MKDLCLALHIGRVSTACGVWNCWGCAAVMLYLGYTMKDIQTWLGHSNYNFMADAYIHSGAGVHEQMAQSLSERLGVDLPVPSFYIV